MILMDAVYPESVDNFFPEFFEFPTKGKINRISLILSIIVIASKESWINNVLFFTDVLKSLILINIIKILIWIHFLLSGVYNNCSVSHVKSFKTSRQKSSKRLRFHYLNGYFRPWIKIIWNFWNLSKFPDFPDWKKIPFSNMDGNPLSYEHTERQAAASATAAASRSHWNALWRSKIGPRPIPKCHPKCQNFKAAARCVYTLTLKYCCLRREITITLGPAYNEHSATTSRFLCINIIDCNVKKFTYNELFLLHLFTRC